MPVKVITTEFGHSMPPESPHNVTVHAKGWDTGMRFREGDPTVFARLQSIYPRFLPLGLVKEVSVGLWHWQRTPLPLTRAQFSAQNPHCSQTLRSCPLQSARS